MGYLAEFWEKLTSVGDYTLEWFQGVGNAVAGAIGKVVLYPLQCLVDLGLAIAYCADEIFKIIKTILLPIKYISIILWSGVSEIYNVFIGNYDPAYANLYENNWQSIQLLQMTPLWSLVQLVIAACVFYMIFLFIAKQMPK